jgi:hypothetical protein
MTTTELDDYPDNVIPLFGRKKLDPVIEHRAMIQAFIRDINTKDEPEITSQDGVVILAWKSPDLEMHAYIDTTEKRVTIHIEGDDISLETVSPLGFRNRWAGYLFDDNGYNG